MPKLNQRETEELERWQRNEGKAEPPRNRGGQAGNLNPMTHGIFAGKCLDEEERVLFREVIERLYTDFEFNKSSDFIQIEFIGINTVKYMRAVEEGNMDAALKLDQMIRAHMKDLKATKIAREGDQPKGPQTTPADWATGILERAEDEPKAAKAKTGRPRKNAKKRSDNTGAPNSEAPVNSGDSEAGDA